MREPRGRRDAAPPSSRRADRRGVGADAVDQRPQTIGALRREVGAEVERAEEALGVGRQDLVGSLAVEEGDDDRDQSPHDERVAVADEMKARLPVFTLYARGEP